MNLKLKDDIFRMGLSGGPPFLKPCKLCHIDMSALHAYNKRVCPGCVFNEVKNGS